MTVAHKISMVFSRLWKFVPETGGHQGCLTFCYFDARAGSRIIPVACKQHEPYAHHKQNVEDKHQCCGSPSFICPRSAIHLFAFGQRSRSTETLPTEGSFLGSNATL